MILNERDVDAISEAVNKYKSDENKRGFLNKCNEFNKQDDDISFISEITVGLDDDRKEENIYSIVEQYKPKMKVVFRHENLVNESELLFDVNMIKSKPGKILKELDSLETVNKLFRIGNFNDIHIEHFRDRKYSLMSDKKAKPINETVFKTGQESLDYDNLGCNYSHFYPETINVIYSYIKQYFMDLSCCLPSYRDTNTKVVGLLYSGGKDSTCRLLELLEQGENVVPIVNTFNSHDSTNLLLRDIATVYNLCKIYETKNFKGTLFRPRFLTYLSYNFDRDYLGLNQQPYNMKSLTVLGKEFLNNCKRIECCLINGDMAVSYISEMKELYKSAMKFNYHVVNGDVKSIPPLVFPYIKLIKDNIIDNLEIRFDNIFNDKEMPTIVPTCQKISIRSIKIAFSGDKYWLYISFKNCGNCSYCKTHINDYFNTLCIPLIEAKPITKDDIVIPNNQICTINSRFSNIFRDY